MPTDIDHCPRGNSAMPAGLLLPVFVVLSVLVVIVPVPPVVLDLLLAANITFAVVLVLASLFVARPLDFSAFPSLLLLTTLARLVLNVASTRLILTRAAVHGTSAGGEVIHMFARFVAQDQVVVGFVIFCILVVIQFVVVTRGATRLSEVAARFALDGMPGRQMAVDADLSAGAITAEEARRQRIEITAQADFHAAMDGAGKFVRGDAVAGILITLVNLVGGMVIGVIQYRMQPLRAAEVFALLTIGDGLVAQIPSFLIGLSAALLATRTSAVSNVSRDVIGQTFREPAVLFLASATTLALVFTGLPTMPLMMLSAGCALAGERVRRLRYLATEENARMMTMSTATQQSIKSAPQPEDQLAVEPIELVLGVRLIRLANLEGGGHLMERVQQLRLRIANELGILLPKVKIRDNLRLRESSYQIKLRGVAVATGDIQPDDLLAIDTGVVMGILDGAASIEPVTGKPAKWIRKDLAEKARALGYEVAEPHQVLMAHLTEVVRSHADELLTRHQVHQLLDNLHRTAPGVIDELIPGLLKLSQVHQVLANLLRERVPVRDLEMILESLGDHAERTKDTTLLTESVRQAMGRVICQPYRDSHGTIHAITLDPALENILVSGIETSEHGLAVKLPPQITEGICGELARQAKNIVRENRLPVVVCGPRTRRALRCITAGPLPKIAILGLNEIPRDSTIRSRGQIPLNAVKIPIGMDGGRRNNHPDRSHLDLVAAAIS